MSWFKTNDSHLKNQLLIEKIEMGGLFPGFYLTGMQYETQLVVKWSWWIRHSDPTGKHKERCIYGLLLRLFFFFAKIEFYMFVFWSKREKYRSISTLNVLSEHKIKRLLANHFLLASCNRTHPHLDIKVMSFFKVKSAKKKRQLLNILLLCKEWLTPKWLFRTTCDLHILWLYAVLLSKQKLTWS